MAAILDVRHLGISDRQSLNEFGFLDLKNHENDILQPMCLVKIEFDGPFRPPSWISAILDFPIDKIGFLDLENLKKDILQAIFLKFLFFGHHL